ncbi:MAG TPA: 50S ribosomal protein L29 [Candidatus Megaira endosymbiont of Hartmannula sinica]|nr:50S ribosomal protein L29 [Candidatus Megaera endosymbiont of Hartmannula sinica]
MNKDILKEELDGKSVADLRNLLNKVKKFLMELRFNKVLNENIKTHFFSLAKKKIARIKTLLNNYCSK